MTDSEQFTRRKHLRELTDAYHLSKYGDYENDYEKFTATYLIGTEPIPQYASVAEDETYGMIHLCETLVEAMADQANITDNGEYLNHPAGIYDLDTGKRVGYRMIALSEEAYTVLCGLVQPNWLTCDKQLEPEAVNHAGIYSEAWSELRTTFPLEHFRKVADERGEDFYHQEAGM